MASIGSIFSEQLRRCKDRLTDDNHGRYERIMRSRGEHVQSLLETNRMLMGENDRLRRELREVSRDYLRLRESIMAQIREVGSQTEVKDG